MPRHDYILFIKSDKSQKWSAQNRGYFWRAKSEKCQKKISKIFIVPNRPKYHTDQLYTYKGYIDPVGFTEKRQKLSKWLFFVIFDLF